MEMELPVACGAKVLTFDLSNLVSLTLSEALQPEMLPCKSLAPNFYLRGCFIGKT